MEKNDKVLELRDELTDMSYRVVVSNEDYERALTDMEFANGLLFHAKVNNMQVLNEPEATEQMEETENYDHKVFDDSGPSTSKSIFWSYEASCRLISSMANHYSDFTNPKKRKYVFEIVCNDLISEGFTVSTLAVQNKWKGLVRSYNKAKDVKSRTGMGPSRFNFFGQMDEILGNKPKNKCTHSINSIPSETPATVLTESNTPEAASTSSMRDEQTDRDDKLEKSKKRRKLSELQLKKEYMELQKKEYDRRQKRHEEYMSVEKKKVALFEEFINLKKKKEGQ